MNPFGWYYRMEALFFSAELEDVVRQTTMGLQKSLSFVTQGERTNRIF